MRTFTCTKSRRHDPSQKGKIMAMEISLDEKGKISPDSELFKQLDEWHDKDEYRKIVEAVLSVPHENWSNKLWFRLISAYNNMEEFDKAREELDKIAPFCDNPADIAKLHYMHGYIYYREDREYLAIAEYRCGLEADPDNTAGLNLENEIEDCRKYIRKNLAKLRSLSEKLYNDIKVRCREKSEKNKLSDEEFTLYLGFLPALRVIPGHEHSIGFDYSGKYESAEKQALLDWLKTGFGITDRESFFDFYYNAPHCNINSMGEEVRMYLAGTPLFDMDQLNSDGRYAFECFTEFIKTFNEFLPDAGVLAWDISEGMGFVRWAYACDIITDADFSEQMRFLHDLAREYFTSFEDYILSLAFGAAFFMFKLDKLNLISSIDYLARTAPLLLHGDLPDLEW